MSSGSVDECSGGVQNDTSCFKAKASTSIGASSTTGVVLNSVYSISKQVDSIFLDNAETTAAAAAMGTSASNANYYGMQSGMQSGYASAQNATLYLANGKSNRSTNSASTSESFDYNCNIL